jgi:hypothetical protein
MEARAAFAAALVAVALAACGTDAEGSAPPAANPPGGAAGPPAGAPPAPVEGLRVWFKLDAAISRGVYLGDVWVSPATFTAVKTGPELAIDVRLSAVEGQGRERAVDGSWTPEDAGVLGVSPREGHEVRLTVRRPGASRLTVSAGGLTTDLTVTASHDGTTWRADFSR